MVEGNGYCARKHERRNVKEIAEFIKNKDKIIVIPDLDNENEDKNRKIKVKNTGTYLKRKKG